MEIEILRSLPQCDFGEEMIKGHLYSIVEHVRPALDHHAVATGVVFNHGLDLGSLFRAPFDKRLGINLVEKSHFVNFLFYVCKSFFVGESTHIQPRKMNVAVRKSAQREDSLLCQVVDGHDLLQETLSGIQVWGVGMAHDVSCPDGTIWVESYVFLSPASGVCLLTVGCPDTSEKTTSPLGSVSQTHMLYFW